MKTGIIFNIQKFSVNDGPGIRTTVFLKGCPLRCIWCHNPESTSPRKEMYYNSGKCTGCLRCGEVCPKKAHSFDGEKHIYDRSICIACGKCAKECAYQAMGLVGEEKTVSQILDEVMKDKAFYENSGGGMTVSGGEPMYQFEFTYELLKAAKEKGLHTCMETCGFAKEENYRKIAEYVDIFLFDRKETDSEKHKEYTGVSDELILKNLKMLDDMGCNIILRCPIIPTLNDREEHLDGIAKLANSLKNISEINIEPYHPLGKGKSELLGKKYMLNDLTFPKDETVEGWIGYVSERTSVPVKKA